MSFSVAAYMPTGKLSCASTDVALVLKAVHRAFRAEDAFVFAFNAIPAWLLITTTRYLDQVSQVSEIVHLLHIPFLIV